MADLAEKREKELLTLRLLALTAENEMLVRDASGSMETYKQLKESQLKYQSSSQEFAQLQAQYSELRAMYEESEKNCAELKAKLNAANDKYRTVTAQVDAYRKKYGSIEGGGGLFGKLKRFIKRLLRKFKSEGAEK